MSALRRWLLTGLAVWLPLAATILVAMFLVDLMDRSLLLLPEAYRPEALLGVHIPGLGVLLTLFIILITGFIAANYFGSKLLSLVDLVLQRVPLIRSVYGGMKSLSDTVLTGSGEAFRKVLLIEYPRKGLYTLAFQTSEAAAEVQGKTGVELVTVFVPTTPNPTSGFIVMVPKAEAVELDMSVEEALKMVISLGVVTPLDSDVLSTIPIKS